MKNVLIIIAVFLLSSVGCATFGGPLSAKEKVSVKSRVQQGKSLFNANGCLDCHKVAKKGYPDGISLDDIGRRRTREFLRSHLRDPEAHVKDNMSAFHGDPNMMPNPNLSEKEVKLVVDYLLTLRH